MALLTEEKGATDLQTALDTGLQNLARDQQLTFTQYNRQALATDGFVFWVSTGTTMTARGSLHVSAQREQEEDATYAINSVLFSSEVAVTAFNDIKPGTMWVTSVKAPASGETLQIAFSRRGPYYEAANLFLYAGFAVYAPLKSQLVASASDLPAEPIVSNSLPIWLSLNSIAPVYPSYLVPDNIEPPFIAAHIDPDMTKAIQAFPSFGWSNAVRESGTGAAPLYQLPSNQLMRDSVRLTLYGLNNQQAIQYLATLMEHSLNTDDFGFMNSPAIRDDKRAQVEIAAIAMQKRIDIEASYFQSTADAIARRQILSASLNFSTQESP